LAADSVASVRFTHPTAGGDHEHRHSDYAVVAGGARRGPDSAPHAAARRGLALLVDPAIAEGDG